MEWYIKVLKQYYDFEGRATRQEYWMFVLINLLISIAISIVERMLGLGGFIGLIYSLAVLLPSLGAGARRLHDTNRSGWLLLIGLIPILGWIAVIYFLAQPGQAGENQYGSDPNITSA